MNKGFTLIELVISIFILSVGIIGVFNAFSIVTILTTDSTDRLTATYLAQEGMEIARNLRDTNWIQMDDYAAGEDVGLVPSWSNGLTNVIENDSQRSCENTTTGCSADFQQAPVGSAQGQGSLYLDSNGFYSTSVAGTLTKFKRKIFITPIIDVDGNAEVKHILKVKTNVSWDKKANIFGLFTSANADNCDPSNCLSTEETLYNWYNTYIFVTNVTINSPASITLGINESRTLIATVVPSYATETAVVWTSSDTSGEFVTLEVDGDGNAVVTAVAPTADAIEIRATSLDGKKSALVLVSVSTEPGGGTTPTWTCGINKIQDTRDIRNGVVKEYSTVLISTQTGSIVSQCWMAENMDIGESATASTTSSQGSSCSTIYKYCYNNIKDNCNSYGGLYQWNQAMCSTTPTEGAQGICPAGWHIPSHHDLTTLEKIICLNNGGTDASCTTSFPYDFSTTGARGTAEGTTLKSGATGNFNGSFVGAYASNWTTYSNASNALYWSSTVSAANAWARRLTTAATITRGVYPQGNAFSVRCVQDSSTYTAVESVSIQSSYASLSPGNSYQFYATINPLGATIQTVDWSSNNANVTVTNTGYVTVSAGATGSVTITATSPGGGIPGTVTLDIVSWTCGMDIQDSRDSKSYGTVAIGNQCWMAENLNVGDSGSIAEQNATCSPIVKTCYLEDPYKCADYGGLYKWTQAMCGSTSAGAKGICPTGWHIPTHTESTILERTVCSINGGTTCSTDFPDNTTTMSVWLGTHNEGTWLKNSSNFYLKLAGYYTGSAFSSMGTLGYYWNSTGSGSNAWYRAVGAAATSYRNNGSQGYGFSVRCVQDSPPVIGEFIASPTTIVNGSSTTLSWTFSGGNPTALSIDNGIGSVFGLLSKSVSPTQTTTYTLTATNSLGSDTKQVTVTVTLPPAATPTFTPSAGTILNSQAITLSTTTSGASIYYTIDGSTPTSGSTLYSAPFTLQANSTTTVKAIAIKSGFNDSVVASATYTTIANSPVTGVRITDSAGNDITSKSLRYNTSYQLYATVSSLIPPPTNPAVTWSSSNSSIISVTSAGLITAKTYYNTATITVRTVDGGFTDTVAVTATF